MNGRPTKNNVVWCSLVNVNHVKTAITCNWLYRNVYEKYIDESSKQIIEVSNNATTQMLKKVSPDEVDTCIVRRWQCVFYQFYTSGCFDSLSKQATSVMPSRPQACNCLTNLYDDICDKTDYFKRRSF